MCKKYEPRFKILPSGEYYYKKIELKQPEKVRSKRIDSSLNFTEKRRYKYQPVKIATTLNLLNSDNKNEELQKIRTRIITDRLPDDLTLLQIFQAYESHSQRLLQDLLMGGYHESYDILFNLILDNRNRLKGQIKDLVPLLENQPKKLTMIVVYLKQAEIATYEEDFEMRYTSHRNLAKELIDQEPEMASQFFEASLEDANLKGWDNTRAQGEAHRNMGMYILKTDLEKAHSHFMTYYQIMRDKRHLNFDEYDDAMFKNGEEMFSDACHLLASTYMEYGNYKMAVNSYTESFDNFNKAYNIALEDGDKNLIAKCLRKLGDINLRNKLYEQSLEYFIQYLNLGQQIGNMDLVANANEAIGSVYVKMDNLDEANKYYTQCVKISHKSEDKMAYAMSCLFVGQVQNNAGRYEAAYEYFKTAFDQTQNKIDLRKATATSRAFCGVAKANLMSTLYKRYIFSNSSQARDSLLDWKEFRVDGFAAVIPSQAEKMRREQRLLIMHNLTIQENKKKQLNLQKYKVASAPLK